MSITLSYNRLIVDAKPGICDDCLFFNVDNQRCKVTAAINFEKAHGIDKCENTNMIYVYRPRRQG